MNIVSNGTQHFPVDDSTFCSTSTSSVSPAPLCRQFWKAGNYNDQLTSKPTCQNSSGYLRIHPKFLHSNATSHKWAFGALAELLDNSIDEVQNGATRVIFDKISNPRDGTTALLVKDDGGGMDPDAIRRCLSFGFSDKKSKTTIGQYGNGFKTSSMRLGADVIVFSRNTKTMTQSIGLLSYTFLMQTHQDRILVPMVNYQFNIESATWNTLQTEHQLKDNLSILLQWSPFTTEAELLNQCDDIGHSGTKIIIYNLWHNDEGHLELDFESDPEDICIRRCSSLKGGRITAAFDQHLANQLQYSLRNSTLLEEAYLSILYLKFPKNFSIWLCGRVVEYRCIASDLQYEQCVMYKPQNVEGSVNIVIGFLKEAPKVDIHGFNVYHKNRLILPYFKVLNSSIGRGVVGVLEADFIQPTHNKQDFEKTQLFQKLETRLRDMTKEYWNIYCGCIGYSGKKPRASITPRASSVQKKQRDLYQPVLLIKDSSKQSCHSQGTPLKRKGHDKFMEPERVKRTRSQNETDHSGNVQHAVDPENLLDGPAAVCIIQENKKLHSQCQEFEKRQEELNLKHAVNPENQLEDPVDISLIQENTKLHAQCHESEKRQEELNLKVTRLKAAVQEAQREYVGLMQELKLQADI